jgi:formylglycine-generating enzyme required for sulfatase activity
MSMKAQSRTTSIALSVLALGAAVAAQAAAPLITDIALVPRLTIQSDVGVTNQIQYTNNLSQSNWAVLTNLAVTQSPYYFVDVTAPSAAKRFYRVVPFPTNSAVPGGMVLIPAGSFIMGNCMDPAEGAPDERTLRSVSVSGFYMDSNLVSYTLWQQVYQWSTNHGYGYDNAGSAKASTHPVQTVNWYDVVKWCNARSQQAGLTPCYYTDPGLTAAYKTNQAAPYVNWTAIGYRLPTEAEWEKAARGGASGHRFPWSDADTINWSRANYYAYAYPSGFSYDVNPSQGCHPTFAVGGEPYTNPGGYFAANGYGLYDMAGNVRQWCWDWYGAYSSGPQTDPQGPASGSAGSYRVFRSGGWRDDAFSSRAAARGNGPPDYKDYDVGFRSVLIAGQ